MARIRSIHPNMAHDEGWMELILEDAGAAVLLLALGTYSDYANRFRWDLEAIYAHGPLEEIPMRMDLLEARGHIVREDDRHGLILFKYGFSRIYVTKWQAIRSMILARDNYTCTYCGDQAVDLHCDHILPVVRGGSNDPQNLTTACKKCNLSKGPRLLAEWRS